MVAGPEVGRLVLRYDAASGVKGGTERTGRRERTERARVLFLDKVDELTGVVKDVGNPFEEDGRDLFSLDAKHIANPSAAALIRTRYESGKTRFQWFTKGFEEEEPKLYEPIENNCVNFFRREKGAEGGLPALLQTVYLMPEQRM